MKLLTISTLIFASVFMLSACGKKEPQAQPESAQSEAEIPMSAEPAEPTGVMNVEPVEMQNEEPISPDKKGDIVQDDMTAAPENTQGQN